MTLEIISDPPLAKGKKNHNKGPKAATEVLTVSITASYISDKAVLAATPGSFLRNYFFLLWRSLLQVPRLLRDRLRTGESGSGTLGLLLGWD